MTQSSPMNGGDGKYSYTNNSTLQEKGASLVKNVMKEALMNNLNIEKLLSGSTTLVIADLGCSVGPNTFTAMQTIIETVEEQQGSKKPQLEFQVLFNDQTANDFNTLFASLPQPWRYFAAAVPGSFHGRLFPSSSVHIAYSAYALQWLSQSPVALQVRDSPAWNAGRIHHVGASSAVVRAYEEQFEADMAAFLAARAAEVVEGGMVVIMVTSVSAPEGGNEHEYATSVVGSFFESILMEMVREGVVEEEKVDSFNVPTVSPCMNDMRKMVEKNGCFEIVKMELGDVALPTNGDGEVDLERVLPLYRAASEATFASHFGEQIADQVFSRALRQHRDCSRMMRSLGTRTTATHLFAALKRK